ncbi:MULTISPECIES: hypothetical protein [Acinetobacter]|uniref:hypothetical protein n=1 Tax=Acinetobacter TaxID=469 RepID=UPI0015D2A8BD|nr:MULTISPECIES: hypothetical protein [Acinetobacter]UIP25393.1 hypothetical protein LZG54_01300 [Acinetobacter towneri]
MNFKKFDLERYFLYLVVFFTIAIILNGSYLPMVDLPQHAGQVAALNDLIKGQSHWHDLVELNFRTPYLVGYLSWLVLLQFFDIVTSSRVLVSLAFLLFVFSVNKLQKKIQASNIVTWIAIPSFFGFNYEWGFITYLIAISIGILFFIQNIKLAENLNIKNCLLVTLFGVFLFFSHILSFLFFCLLSFVFVFFNLMDKKKILKILPLYFVFFLLVIMYLSIGDTLSSQYDYGVNVMYHSFTEKVKNLMVYPFSMASGSVVIYSILLLIAPFLMGYMFTKDAVKYIPLSIFILVWFSLPYFINNTYFIYERYSILFFVFYYIIFDKLNEFRYENYFKALFLFVIIYLLSDDYKNIIFAKKETVDFATLVNKLPEEKRVLGLIFEPISPSLTVPFTYVHFGSWYQAQKGGWSDFNFAWFHPQIVRYKPDQTPEAKPGFEWRPYDILKLNSCQNYDMFIVRAYDLSIANVIEHSPCHNYRIRFSEGNWLVFGK